MIPTGYPYFRWWLRDAEADEFYRTASDAEIGFFHRCLNRSWDSGGLPADPAKRAILLGKTRAYADKMWKAVGTKFIASELDPSRLVNSKQESERSYVHSMSERNSRAGKTRSKFPTSVKQSLDIRYSTGSANGRQHAYGSDSDSVSNSEKEKNQKVAALWESAGFLGPEYFDEWWLQVVANHPNKNRNTDAYMEIQGRIITGQFSRVEFESGYFQLRESKADEWTKEGGKYCTNLYEIVHNRLWKFTAEVKDEWLRELELEQAEERRQSA